MQDEILLLSSGKNILADQTHLFSPLMKSFEKWVWIFSLIALIFVSIIKSLADILLNDNKKIKLMKLIETNLFFHHGNILRQGNSRFMNENQIFNSF
jgi:hypothetical protein